MSRPLVLRPRLATGLPFSMVGIVFQPDEHRRPARSREAMRTDVVERGSPSEFARTGGIAAPIGLLIVENRRRISRQEAVLTIFVAIHVSPRLHRIRAGACVLRLTRATDDRRRAAGRADRRRGIHRRSGGARCARRRRGEPRRAARGALCGERGGGRTRAVRFRRGLHGAHAGGVRAHALRAARGARAASRGAVARARNGSRPF